jgi:replicative DNA helicase Mcm
MKRYLISTRKGEKKLPNEYSKEDLVSRWEEFFDATHYRLNVIEVSTLFPELRSVYVRYSDLDAFDPDMADFVLQHPNTGIWAGEQAIQKVSPPGREGALIHLRLVDLPRDCRVEIRDLRSKHMGKLISIEGLVRKATEVRPKIVDALFECLRCNAIIKEPQEGMSFKEPLECYEAQGGCGKSSSSTKFKLLTEDSTFVDTQKIEIQESPEGLRGGAQPERLVGFMEDDIAGDVSPGDRVILNGSLRSVQKGTVNKSTLFDIHLDVISMEFEEHEYEEVNISEEDEARIKEEAADPNIYKNIVASISPTIYGYDIEKESIALQLFGGVSKELDDGTRIRGDIHILLVGDPGVAKSQLLRYMSTLAPRGIYASGKSSSAAGLCVSPLTHILADGEDVHIEDFVEERMRFPEEYREGIEREMISGPKVACVNGNGEVIQQEVEAIWRINTPSFLVELETSEKRWLRCTAETKVWSRRSGSEGWRQADELNDGDEMLWRGYKGDQEPKWLPIVKIMHFEDDLPRYVYDLTVKNTHAFLGNGFLVHNTAAAVKDDFGEGRWTLEAGALVLADKGVACVDELDKMTDQDRSSMHEAMESQTVSVAKAGITATLQCRCSILGAANPKYGRFEEHQYIADQINLPPALMSRFDLIFAMTDKPDVKKDSQITNHILKAHWRGQIRKYSDADLEDMPGVPVSKIMEETQELSPVWSVDFFRKYVAFSKRIVPVLTEDAMKIIHDYYMEIRKQGEDQGSVPITARQLEAFVRISEASARARLSNTVLTEDARRAVRLVEYYLKKIAGQEGQIDIDIIATGTSRSQRDQITVLRRLISELSDGSKGVSVEALLQAAESEGIAEDKMRRLLKKLSEAGEIYQPHAGYYRLAMEG